MRPLAELIDTSESAWRLIQRWVAAAELPAEVLPPAANKDDVLLQLQLTTRSLIGAIAYHTGGVLVDNGWLRFPGSGHERLPRNLADWNAERGDEYFLVADDAVGGFFAIRREESGSDEAVVHYWAPDNLAWEPLGFRFADFLQWSLTACLAEFYQHLRWPNCKRDVSQMGGDHCCAFEPPLWTNEGSPHKSSRRVLPVAEAYALKANTARQQGKTSET